MNIIKTAIFLCFMFIFLTGCSSRPGHAPSGYIDDEVFYDSTNRILQPAPFPYACPPRRTHSSLPYKVRYYDEPPYPSYYYYYPAYPPCPLR